MVVVVDPMIPLMRFCSQRLAAWHATTPSRNTSKAMTGDSMPSICVFDVNETLLDIKFLAPLFERVFGDAKVLREWFAELILYSEAITLSGPYTPFFALGQGVLKILGSIHSVAIREDDVQELRERMLTVPAHSDVPTGLKQLKDAGFRLVTLTNSPRDPEVSPLRHAGIDRWFEGHSASIACDDSNRRPRSTTWSPRSWVCHRPRFVWSRPMCGIRSGRKALAVREHLSPAPAMRLFRFMVYLSRRWWRRISQAWPPKS